MKREDYLHFQKGKLRTITEVRAFPFKDVPSCFGAVKDDNRATKRLDIDDI